MRSRSQCQVDSRLLSPLSCRRYRAHKQGRADAERKWYAATRESASLKKELQTTVRVRRRQTAVLRRPPAALAFPALPLRLPSAAFDPNSSLAPLPAALTTPGRRSAYQAASPSDGDDPRRRRPQARARGSGVLGALDRRGAQGATQEDPPRSGAAAGCAPQDAQSRSAGAATLERWGRLREDDAASASML